LFATRVAKLLELYTKRTIQAFPEGIYRGFIIYWNSLRPNLRQLPLHIDERNMVIQI